MTQSLYYYYVQITRSSRRTYCLLIEVTDIMVYDPSHSHSPLTSDCIGVQDFLVLNILVREIESHMEEIFLFVTKKSFLI